MRVLDSDHCVEILRRRLDVSRHADPDEVLGVTSISIGELVHGAQRSTQAERNMARIEVLVAAVIVLPYDETAARLFGRLKAELQRRGTPLADLDLQIAAICIEANAPLVTHNGRHFGRIIGLKVEDWLA